MRLVMRLILIMSPGPRAPAAERVGRVGRRARRYDGRAGGPPYEPPGSAPCGETPCD